jgi:hypothetical protein
MKRKLLGLFIVMMGLVFMGCPNPAANNTPEPQIEKGTLSVSIIEAVSRTLLPTISMDPTGYVISGVGPSSAVFSVSTIGNETIENLVPGLWTITVTAKNASNVAIGDGSNTVTIVAGENKALSISVNPYDGFGTLTINLEWTVGVLSSPVVEAKVDTNGVERTVAFTITGNAASFSANDFSTGYHTLVLKLKDGTTVVGAAVETVRIVKDQITTGTLAFDVSNPAGGVVVTITPELNNPLQVALTGGSSSKLVSQTQALNASVSNYTGTLTYTWYVNGTNVATGSSFDFESTYAIGKYRIDVIAFTADKKRAGNASRVISVVEASAGTSLTMTLIGDDVSLFKLALPIYGGMTNSSTLVQASPATWNLDFMDSSTNVLVRSFIDSDIDNVLDQNELTIGTWLTINKGMANSGTVTLGKSTINVTVSGNTTIFTHPMLVYNGMQQGSTATVVAPFANGNMVTYGDITASNGASGNLRAFDDLNNNYLYDYGEPTISIGNPETEYWAYAATKNVSIALMTTAPQILPEGEKIEMGIGAASYYPSDLLHYRFVFDSSQNKVIFVMPVGIGTDGGFITCYQCETDPPRSSWHSGDHLWNLFNIIYAGDSEKRNRVMNNYSQQLVEFKQNIKDIVTYLEDTKGFTVYGKETLPSNW